MYELKDEILRLIVDKKTMSRQIVVIKDLKTLLPRWKWGHFLILYSEWKIERSTQPCGILTLVTFTRELVIFLLK